MCGSQSCRPKQLVLLGSTGSIGLSTLDVVAACPDIAQVFALTAHRNLSVLVAQAQQFRPRYVVATDAALARQFDWTGLPAGTTLRIGPEGAAQCAAEAEVDVVVSAVVGSAGLIGTWAAVEAGKLVALANKETLVLAGRLVNNLAKQTGATILPVDSEHSAIFQALSAGRRQDLQRVVLTASGGPFRNYSQEQMEQVTVADALAHPTWDMGPKITVDSATMMNKALEIIEAFWLFDLTPEQIGVVIHPQSIVHSMVEFIDGSVIAQLSPPDMRLPIQYALTYPERCPSVARKLNWQESFQLDFFPPDFTRFPALTLGLEAARQGGTFGAVLNAANETAVEQFLAGKLQFTRIVAATQAVLEHHTFDPNPSLDQLLEADRWARQEVIRWARI